MEAITKKYLDLYAALSGELQERPQLLNHYREAAYDAFARLGVPRFKSEDYQRTDLPSLFAEDWKLHVLDGAPYWASQAFAPEIFIGAFSDSCACILSWRRSTTVALRPSLLTGSSR